MKKYLALTLLIERLESKNEEYVSRTTVVKTELRFRESSKVIG